MDFLNNLELTGNPVLDVVFVSIILMIGMYIYKLAVTGRLKEHGKMKKQAETDPLTGRGNRHKFVMDLDDKIKKNKKFAICFMDLDGFKNVNDTLGHDAGDMLLIELSNRLENSLPKICESYRLGGDEFSIIIEKINTIEEISKILDRLKESLTSPVIIKNNKIVLQYSLGVAIYPEDATQRQDLMTYADDAMYHIKEHGKNNYYFFNNVLKSKLENKKKMQDDLKKAFENKEFSLSYQPRISTNNVDEIMFEALIYWIHPVLGKLNAEYFIPQAEEMGFIVQLDEFVLSKVCDKLKELKTKHNTNIKMSINMSNVHSKRHNFVDKLCEIIQSYNFDEGDLEFEFIDEIPIKNITDYKYFTEKLSDIGVRTSIPSFEVKHETLEIFNKLNIDTVKLSSKYVNENSKFNEDTLNDIIKLSKDLGYKTVVTSVETKKELEYVIKAKADFIQGDFVFNKLEDNELDNFIKKYNTLTGNIKEIINENK